MTQLLAQTIGRVAELIRRFGLLQGLRISWSIFRHRPVPIPGVGLLPYDGSAVYHVLESTDKLRRLADYVEPGDLVFDIGAHAGLFSVLAARAGARVVAVEPDPYVASFLRANARGMQVETVEAAMAPTNRSVTLWRNLHSSQTSSLIRGAAECFGAVESITVSAVTWQQLVDQFGLPDVVKLDVQGFESRLVESMPVDQFKVLLVEVSELDDIGLADVLSERFGSHPVVVNQVYGGADLAFTRR